MNQGYVVKMGKAYVKAGYVDECVLTKTFERACIFTKKKDAIELGNRFGGTPMEINLRRLEDKK